MTSTLVFFSQVNLGGVQDWDWIQEMSSQILPKKILQLGSGIGVPPLMSSNNASNSFTNIYGNLELDKGKLHQVEDLLPEDITNFCHDNDDQSPTPSSSTTSPASSEVRMEAYLSLLGLADTK